MRQDQLTPTKIFFSLPSILLFLFRIVGFNAIKKVTDSLHSDFLFTCHEWTAADNSPRFKHKNKSWVIALQQASTEAECSKRFSPHCHTVDKQPLPGKNYHETKT